MRYIIILIFASFVNCTYSSQYYGKDANKVFEDLEKCIEKHDVKINVIDNFFEVQDLRMIDRKLKHWAHCYLEAVGTMKGKQIIDKERYAGIPDNLDEYDTAIEILKMNKKYHTIFHIMEKCLKKYNMKADELKVLFEGKKAKPFDTKLRNWLHCFIELEEAGESEAVINAKYKHFNEYNVLLKALKYGNEKYKQ
uniref:Uncharacterized protein n=1 Tax=Glossina palpalis gambiensis TaxID=67801 RepID=A0A1B0BVH9_9MUSC